MNRKLISFITASVMCLTCAGFTALAADTTTTTAETKTTTTSTAATATSTPKATATPAATATSAAKTTTSASPAATATSTAKATTSASPAATAATSASPAATATSEAKTIATNTDSNTPSVYIDGVYIRFDDQKPVIQDDRTLVPARGVFEAMGCTVSWNGEKSEVTINSASNINRVVIAIGSTILKTYKFTSIMSSTETDKTIDVPAQIINSRTMIPLRAVSEAFNADVNWDAATSKISITTKEETDKIATGIGDTPATTLPSASTSPATQTSEPVPVVSAAPLSLSLSADKKTAAVGDEVTLSVNIAGMSNYANAFVSGVTVVVTYDKANFSLESASLTNGDKEISGGLGVNNPDYDTNALKAVYVTVNGETAASADGAVMKLKFKALKASATSFALSNSYNTRLGYDTTILLGDKTDSAKSTMYEGKTLKVDETPVVVNAAK